MQFENSLSGVRHCIGSGVLGDWPYLDISADEYESLKKAKANIFILLGIEEKFDMVVENYLEYERDLLNLALGHMTRHDTTWFSMSDARSLVNRRLANLLTLSRMYIDQAKQDLASVYGATSETTNRVSRAFSEQYDRLLGYRVMEAKRNSLQHRSLPITGIIYPSEWEERKNGSLLHHRFTATLDVNRLREDSGFKKAVLLELEKAGKTSRDVTPFVREYVEGLSLVNKEIRSLTSADIGPWSEILVGLLERYKEACGHPFEAIVAYETNEEQTFEEVQIFCDGTTRLQQLRTTFPATTLSRWFVSSESA